MYVLGGRPGVGTTTLAINIAMKLLIRGKNVKYCSYQMSAKKLLKRMMVYLCAKTAQKKRYIDDENIKNLNLHIDDDPDFLLMDMETPIECQGTELPKYDLVVIDNFQELKREDLSERDICKMIKENAKRENNAVLLLTSLPSTDEFRMRKDYTPTLGDLYGPYAVSEFTDVVMLLSRDDYYDVNTKRRHVADLHIVKNITGLLATIHFVCIFHFQRIEELRRNDE